MRIRYHYKEALGGGDTDRNPALESAIHEDTQYLAVEMEQCSLEMRRLSDIADALQDLTSSVEHLQSADPHHLRLVETCLNMAQAGTFATAEQIQPSLENYLGTPVSMEGVSSAIRQFITNLLRLMREIWHRIQDFLVRTLGEVGRLRIRLQYVSSLVAEIDGKSPVRDRVPLGNSVYGVSTEAGVPKDARSLIVPLEHLLQQTKAMRTHVVPVLLAVGEQLNGQLRTLPATADEANLWLQQLNAIAGSFHPHALAHSMGPAYVSHNPDYPSGAALVTASLPGSRSLVFIDGTKVYPDKSKGDVEEQAMAYQNHAILLQRQRQAVNIDLTKAWMETLTNDQLQEIHRLVEELVEEVDEALRSGLKNRLLGLAKPAEQIEKQLNQLNEAEMANGLVRRGLRYWPVYSGWIQASYMQLLAHDLMVARAMLTLVSRHCAAYHSAS